MAALPRYRSALTPVRLPQAYRKRLLIRVISSRFIGGGGSRLPVARIVRAPFRPPAALSAHPVPRARQLATRLRFDSRHLLLKKKTLALRRGSFFWRWRESNPRPATRKGGFYRCRRPFKLSGGGRRAVALSSPYPAICPPCPAGEAGGKPWSGCRPDVALRAGHRGVRRYRRLRGESEVAVVVGN